MTRSRPPLKILQWNAAYLYKDKLNEFRKDLSNLNPSIVLLSETNWKDEYKVKFAAYNVFCLNRQAQRGGGVAILVKKTISASTLSLPDSPNLEVIGVSLKLNRQSLDVVSVYCPHGDCIPEEIQRLFDATGDNAFVAGDFNAYSQIWTSNMHTNQAGDSIESYLETNDKFSCVTPFNLKTRRNTSNITTTYSTIDLTFTTANLAESTLTYTGPLDWNSDHVPIISEIAICPTPRAPEPINWTFEDYKWVNWNEDLEINLREKNFDSLTEPAAISDAFYSSINSASQKHFTPKSSENRREPDKPWWNQECKNAVSRARKARRAWLKNPNNTRLKTKLNRQEALKKKTIESEQRELVVEHRIPRENPR